MQQGVERPPAVATALGQGSGGLPSAEARFHQSGQLLAEADRIPASALRFSPPHNHRAFPQGGMGAEMLQGGLHGGPHLFLMALGEFPSHPQGAIAQLGKQILQEGQQPVRRFIEHQGALLRGQGREPIPPGAAPGGQEAFEAEAACRKATAHQGGGEGTGTRDADHRMAVPAGRGHQPLPGIGDAWQARVTDHGHRFPRRQGFQQLGHPRSLIVGMEAQQAAPANPQPAQQQAAVAGVLAGDAIGLLQHPPGPRGEVRQVADRGSHQIEGAAAGLIAGRAGATACVPGWLRWVRVDFAWGSAVGPCGIHGMGWGLRWRHRFPHADGSCTMPLYLPMMPPASSASSAAPSLPAGISLDLLLPELRRLAWGAADILRAYGRGQQPPFGFPPVLAVEEGGEGPVSAADLAVNEWLLQGLAAAFPNAPWTLLSEETAKQQLRPGEPLDAEWLWILDPLDGTRDFLQGSGEYAVHLALVHQGRPALGVVLLPEPEELWFGLLGEGGEPAGAWREDRSGRCSPPQLSERGRCEEMVLVASRNHRDPRLERLLEAIGAASSRAMGSVGGKVATILRGEADLYVSLSGRTAPKDWDMAAPEAVLRAAGGAFSHADGRPLAYNTGTGSQSGCLIASHGSVHAEVCRRALCALAEEREG